MCKNPVYPGNLKTFDTNEDNVTTIDAQYMDERDAEIEAIESTLGINVHGSANNLATRLNTSLASDGRIKHGAEAEGAIVTPDGVYYRHPTDVARYASMNVDKGIVYGDGPVGEYAHDYWRVEWETLPASMEVDLGRIYYIDGIQFESYYRKDNRHIPRDYKIEYSTDNVEWYEFADADVTGNGSSFVSHFVGPRGITAARYIKLTISAYQPGYTLVNVSNFRVWARHYASEQTKIHGNRIVKDMTNIDNIYPSADDTYTLGASSKRWSTIYARTTNIGHILEGSILPMEGETFEAGDLVIFEQERFRRSYRANDRRVFGVIDETPDGPIPCNFGVFQIKVNGVVREGDFLVSSDEVGVAMINNEAPRGCTIGQAIGGHDGDSASIIKAYIRKF